MTSAVPLIALMVAAAACGRTRESIRVDGSPGVAPLVLVLVDEYRASNPAVAIALASGLGSSARIRAVQDGTIDVAMASHGVDSADLTRRGLVAHEIARTAVVFAVNESVRMTSVTRAQVCDIYAGRVAAWQQLGATGGAVIAFMRPADEVDAEVALESVDCLRGLELGGWVTTHARADEMAEALARTSGAIGVTSMTYVLRSGGRVRALALDGVAPASENVGAGSYALTRRAILVTKSSPSPAVDALLAFIRSDAGARVIRDNGAVPATASP